MSEKGEDHIMTAESIERVAKAILELHPSWSWEKANEATKEHYRRKARAVIEAMLSSENTTPAPPAKSATEAGGNRRDR